MDYSAGNLDAVGEMLTHPNTVPGLSDGGAHVGTISDASFPTTLLAHWGRDRTRGRIDLPLLVARQCRATAEAVGLLDPRMAAPGYRADLTVVDPATVRVRRPQMVADLPGRGTPALAGG